MRMNKRFSQSYVEKNKNIKFKQKTNTVYVVDFCFGNENKNSSKLGVAVVGLMRLGMR